MPRFAFVLALSSLPLLPGLARAQQYDRQECASQAEMVMTGVNARAEGRSRDQAIDALADRLPTDVAGMLVDWIYALPPELLTDKVGEAWRAQCEAL
ncbi:hypothetical protein [Citreimonas sp.]|uniref:hypothetical protein n=1 Tax=Citreimonas sp. TaxID=3036715 RepID=UPI0035C7A839